MNAVIDLRRLWAWKLHWYRQSELEGALLLGRMVRLAADPQLCQRLTRHCADEARHSLLWSETIADLELPHVRIYRSYQSLYAQAGGAPATLVEVLAFTQIFERRVHRQFLAELRDRATPDRVRCTLQGMIADEKGHLSWVREWLQTHPESDHWLQRYREIDLRVHDQVRRYADCLWDLPGLGRESNSDAFETRAAPKASEPVAQP